LNFPWIKEASENLKNMIINNISGPNELLDQYKEYEYIINTDKKALIDDLFSGGEEGKKRTLEEIKDKILHYEDAHYKIMTLSEDEVNFRIFRVMSKKIKE
jgi:hypothetical protein